MFDLEEYSARVDVNLRRIRLAKDVIDEVHRYILDPMYPDEKADLLIAAEELAESSFHLMEEVQSIVWGTEPTKKKKNQVTEDDVD